MEAKDIATITDITQSSEILNSLFAAIPSEKWESYEEREYFDRSVEDFKQYTFGEQTGDAPQRMTYYAFAKIKGGKARFRFKTSNTNVVKVDNFHFWMGNYTFTFDPTPENQVLAQTVATKMFEKEIVDTVNKLVNKHNKKSWWNLLE